MKRKSSMIGLIFLLFIVTACNKVARQSNTIDNATLTDRESAVLSMLTTQSFVFDFNVDDDFEEVSIWVEKYEFGELVEEQVSSFMTTIEREGSIVVVTSEMNDEKMFNIGVNDEDGSGSVSNTIKHSAEMPSVWGSFPEGQTITEKELVLGSIVYSSDEFGVSSVTNDFYDNPEAHMEELEEYDIVYLLKVKFKK